jgi:transcriptional regulator with XRE-family HTH domain
MTSRPKPTSSKTSLAEFIATQVDMSDMTQKEIAQELGYPNPNIITMFKQGITKVPINKIPKFAEVLGIDAKNLLARAMEEYSPEVWESIQSITGHLVKPNELELVKLVREAVSVKEDSDLPELNAEARKQFKTAAKALK